MQTICVVLKADRIYASSFGLPQQFTKDTGKREPPKEMQAL